MELYHPLWESSLFHGVDAEALLERWPVQHLGPGQHLVLTPGQLLYVARGCVGLARGVGGGVRSVLWSPRFHLTRHTVELHAFDHSEIAVFPFEQLAPFAGERGWPAWKALLVRAVLAQRGQQHQHQVNRLGATWWRHHPVDRSLLARRCAQPHRVRLELFGQPLVEGPKPPLPPGLGRLGGDALYFVVARVRDLTWSQQSTEPSHELALVVEPTDRGLYVHRGWAEDLEALVHGRRRYGLPLRYGLVEAHPHHRGFWAVVGGGRPWAWLHSSWHGLEAYPSLMNSVPSRLIGSALDPVRGEERLLALALPELKLRACSVYGWHDLGGELGGERRRGFHLDQELELGHALWESE